ncbi:hypothetical protein Pan44_04180 [Caulifigura coniformis]|uniref:Uncharacterized protein n=1 Tax=Caulifigura coniformis TaxID=2527983 RepID=A0A517S8F6_9PLAN|nr:hypothetical protein [Caulifigura coniformis]QDT52407.1 hypothetical protein Pan44_04180 [Caulifigura coniformis]
MSDVLVKCCGCDTPVDPHRAVCPGCGHCLCCGRKRARPEILQCVSCQTAYCKCCGRCPRCLSLRYSEITEPCECGHPDRPEVIQQLIDQWSVDRPLTRWERFWKR